MDLYREEKVTPGIEPDMQREKIKNEREIKRCQYRKSYRDIPLQIES